MTLPSAQPPTQQKSSQSQDTVEVRESLHDHSHPSLADTDIDVDHDIDEVVIDYTKIPKLLESKFESLDKEGCVRPTIINVGQSWKKSSKKSLLSEIETRNLNVEDQKKERNAAFDLLDALTKSGGYEVEDASLHVLIAATHCFDRSLMDTVIEKNVNPIEKVEFSSLIMATTIHNEGVDKLLNLNVDEVNRFLENSPSLLSFSR